jgi:BirA family biotin operon repressor/biotin-[acetyl-CoA-carboxylase] ligase
VEDFAPALTGSVRVKWPNDLMIGSKKAAGILIEGDGETVYAGIGVNVGQREFPDHLQQKATSIALAQQAPSPDSPGAPDPRFKLLERILARLFEELEDPAGDREDWRDRLTARLYRINQPVRFLPGAADSGRSVKGLLKGIGPDGELLIIPDGETDPRPYITGELDLY